MRSMIRTVLCLVAVGLMLPLSGGAAPAKQQPKTPQKKGYVPFAAPKSDEGKDALAQFKTPPGFKVALFAAEPRLANPVSFTIDDQNRFYVVETFRRKK